MDTQPWPVADPALWTGPPEDAEFTYHVGEGEYGIDGLYMGVPVKLGKGGIEEILEVDLTEQERGWLEESAAAVRDVVGVLTTTG